jgi:hypothetical protein
VNSRRRVNSNVILLPQLPSLFSIDTPPERIYICGMDYNEDKVDDMVLALLHLTSFGDRGFVRAWKGHDWDALNRLHQKGLISDPKSKSKSVVLSDEGAQKAQELFQTLCGS